jgi:hypothetical protein
MVTDGNSWGKPAGPMTQHLSIILPSVIFKIEVNIFG